MGIIIDLDIETNRGPTKELFVRIDSWRINQTVGEIVFTTTSWLNKEYADKTLRKFLTDDIPNSVGMVANKLVSYYGDPDGKELVIDNLYKMPLGRYKTVETPILEEQEVTKEHPYVSFDEDGNEITLYRTVTSTEQVEVGTKEENKLVADYGILDELSKHCYIFLKDKLADYFPPEKINII